MAQKKLWNIALSGSENEMRNLLLNRSNVDVNKTKESFLKNKIRNLLLNRSNVDVNKTKGSFWESEPPLHIAIQHNQDTGVAKVQSLPLNDSCITKQLKEFWFVCVSTESVFVLDMCKGPVGASYNRREFFCFFAAKTTAHSVN
jgi:hypothetical protein